MLLLEKITKATKIIPRNVAYRII